MDLAGVGEVTSARDTGMHTVCLHVLMSGESGHGACKWQSMRRTRSEVRNLFLDDISLMNQRMRKLRSTMNANLFWKGNIFSSESPHNFSHKLWFYCNQYCFYRGRIVDEIDLSTEVYIDTRSDTDS
ncbi:hypothetical protein Bca101_010657 [Brassica carinata]